MFRPVRLRFADSVEAALRFAGDQQLDIVNLSLFADPYLYYCKSSQEQKAILKDLESAARYAFLNGTAMASPHAAGVAALIKEMHPDWSPGDISAAVQRTAQHLDCPPNWEPLSELDERERCYGGGGRTSFFGHGLFLLLNNSPILS